MTEFWPQKSSEQDDEVDGSTETNNKKTHRKVSVPNF